MSNCYHSEVYQLEGKRFGNIILKCLKCYDIMRPRMTEIFIPTQRKFLGKVIYKRASVSRPTSRAWNPGKPKPCTCHHLKSLHKNTPPYVTNCQVPFCDCKEYCEFIPKT